MPHPPQKSAAQQKESNNSNSNSNSNNDTTIQALRVAQAELSSGNTQGKVFMRLSEGAVALQVDRSKAQDLVNADLRNALLDQSALPK